LARQTGAGLRGAAGLATLGDMGAPSTPAAEPSAGEGVAHTEGASAAEADVADRSAPPGVRIDAAELTRRAGDRALLQGVSLSVAPGELVAIVGGSGAGKTTLLEALAAVRPADEGIVRFDGVDIYRDPDVLRAILGYVPQDDIIHAELPLSTTLRYAARLRLSPALSRDEVAARVATVLRQLDLTERRDVRVSSLSGGQRKRASIAVELLTHPRVCFLDEPTSGLDPSTAAGLMRVLRVLTERGATVVLTTHSLFDLELCDRVVFLATGGRLAFVGAPDEALGHFGVASLADVYSKLAAPDVPVSEARERSDGAASEAVNVATDAARALGPGPLRQLGVLSQRTAETLLRNRLTMGILLGSPAAVVAMFAILFRPGAFDVADPSPSAILMIVFWIAFAAFFFGLTYGLLQVVTERAILMREHLVGLRLGPYVLSKVLVLLPFLLVVDVLMLAVLRGLGRLPTADLGTYASVGITVALVAGSGLTLGLLASSAVRSASQATLALPLLCFPAVLFSGAILPVHVMASVGAAISVAMPVRWAFEAIGRDLGVRELLTAGGAPLGPPLVESYGAAGTLATGTYWGILLAVTLGFLVAAWWVLRATVRRGRRPAARRKQTSVAA
jgi:ABC-type multidrug transport system ATPase subunit